MKHLSIDPTEEFDAEALHKGPSQRSPHVAASIVLALLAMRLMVQSQVLAPRANSRSTS